MKELEEMDVEEVLDKLNALGHKCSDPFCSCGEGPSEYKYEGYDGTYWEESACQERDVTEWVKSLIKEGKL